MEPSNKAKKPLRFIDKVSVYGLEFAVSMVTLLVSVSVLSFASYVLFSYIANNGMSEGAGYSALWFSASTIVWVPVALLFYLRSRAYIAQHPDVTSNAVQRVFTVMFQVVVVLTIISFAVAAVYAVLMSLVKPDTTTNTLVSVALPSAVSALLFAGALVSFFRTAVIRRRTFAVVFLTVSLLITVPTILVSIISLRSLNADEYKVDDLQSIKQSIDDYHRENGKVPAKLSDAATFLSLDETEARLGEYTYKRANDTRYELCADFASASKYTRDPSTTSRNTYQTYASFSSHGKGEVCYKLRAYSFNYESSLNDNDAER